LTRLKKENQATATMYTRVRAEIELLMDFRC
jgi:hypothetical protein